MSTAIRTAKLTIDIPVPGAEPFISGILQKVVVNEFDEVVQVIPRQDNVYRRASKIALELTTITDPVTGQEITLSGAGMSVAITAAFCRWIIEDLAEDGIAAHLNEHGRIIIAE